MHKKLLYKTSRAYLIYAILILALFAPLFYFATQKMYIKDVDESLELHKREFLTYYGPGMSAMDLEAWNKWNRNTKILPAEPLKADSIFFTSYFDTLDNELEPYRELRSSIKIKDKSYTFMSRQNLVENEDLIRGIVLLFVAMLAVLLLGLLFITKQLSKKLWRPFYETLDEIERFEIDKNTPPTFPKTTIEEFNRLQNSLEKLIEKNTIIYQSQREFVENAAHELQTPLAVFQAKIDTLIQMPGIEEEHALVLESLNESVARLTRLNKNLLLLSGLEQKAYSGTERIDISYYLQKQLPFFEEQAAGRQITIQLAETISCEIEANPVLVEILLNNLLLNAIRHNRQGGDIKIAIEQTCLRIENSGMDQPLQPSRLFNRFYKADASGKGTGLGLAIVKKITDRYQWQISYAMSEGRHVFLVDFKKC